jgi:hypothetical protein
MDLGPHPFAALLVLDLLKLGGGFVERPLLWGWEWSTKLREAVVKKMHGFI